MAATQSFAMGVTFPPEQMDCLNSRDSGNRGSTVATDTSRLCETELRRINLILRILLLRFVPRSKAHREIPTAWQLLTTLRFTLTLYV